MKILEILKIEIKAYLKEKVTENEMKRNGERKMKNNYGKLTEKKAIELLYKYDATLSICNHKILDVVIFKGEDKTDSAEILVKTPIGVDRYFISCYGIIVKCLDDYKHETNLITNENPFLIEENKDE